MPIPGVYQFLINYYCYFSCYVLANVFYIFIQEFQQAAKISKVIHVVMVRIAIQMLFFSIGSLDSTHIGSQCRRKTSKRSLRWDPCSESAVRISGCRHMGPSIRSRKNPWWKKKRMRSSRKT